MNDETFNISTSSYDEYDHESCSVDVDLEQDETAFKG
jgi:hypothetical protein